MSNIVNLYKQEDESIDDCVFLSPLECAEYLIWAYNEDKKSEFNFAMSDDGTSSFGKWWGAKLSFEFDFAVILCGHFGALGNDFECETLNNLLDEHRYDEDVALCKTVDAKKTLVIGKYLGKLNKDYDGNPDHFVVEIHEDIIYWLEKVKGTEFKVIEPEHRMPN